MAAPMPFASPRNLLFSHGNPEDNDMLVPRLAALVVVAASLLTPVMAQDEALGIPGPIVFEDTTFDLAWTSHPSDTYYKQEYLPAGETVEAYSQMFMIDVLVEGATPESAAADMIAGLKERQASDPVVNFDMIANEATGELILDFLLSDTSSGAVIVEWNAYRYVPHGDGLALFAISRRGYDDDASDFIGRLAEWRTRSIEALAAMELPEVVLD
jgi:hypothetical protein